MKSLKIYTFLLLAFLFATTSLNAQTARVQIIHNSADAAASVVDVWLNNTKLIENFAFRTATPYIVAPAGVLLNIGIAPPNSTSWTQSFRIKQVSLTENETYVIVAGGIISTSGYNPSPTFLVSVYPIGCEVASQAANTDVLVVHGATDAPTVDIYETGVGAGQIVNNLMYGNVAGYLELPTANYVLELRDETGTVTVASYSVPLATLGLQGKAITVLASGFLNPSANSNGAPFGLFAALPSGGALVELPLYTPSARVQVIHNAADAAAEVVDVWLNDTKLIADFAFRTATPFIDAPAGVEFTIAIKPPGSTSPANPIWSQNYTLMVGGSYILVANGLVDNQNYLPFKPFDIYVLPTALESASAGNETAISVFHGSTDAPTVDIVEVGVGAGTIVDDLSYGNFVDYLNVITADYVVEVRDATGTVTVASYAVPLATLGLHGQAVTVLASGFLNPSANNNGAPFGLYVALASGGNLIDLPVYSYTPTARLQVIHNAADAAAASVDVWLNDTKLVADFAFRTATSFVDAPFGVEFTIAIQAPGSTSPANPIWSQNYTLADGGKYILVANGLVDNQNYTPFKPFDIYVLPTALESAANSNETAVAVFHGSTDAPTVDVVETGVGAGTIIDNFEYGNFAGYLNLPTANYVLEVRDETGTVTVASYSAPLATLGLQGQALTVLASGFLNPAANNNGAPFGLYVALAAGGALVELPVYTPSARVQVIHNAADAAAASVDVWLNDTKLLADFAFRTATPFIDAPAGVEFTIAIQAPGSTSPANPIWSQNYTLTDGETYVLIANGLVDNQNYTSFKPFDIYVYPMGREASASSNLTDVLVFHGSTDAPTVDVVETGVGAGTIIDNFEYGTFNDYISLDAIDYILAIKDETGSVTVASFAAPLGTLGLGGQAITVVASGFLNPVENNNGESFGLYAALASGGALVQLPVVTSLEEKSQIGAFNLYPNPATSKVNISLDILSDSEVTVSIYNIIGSLVRNESLGRLSNGMQSKSIDVTDLSEGVYLMKVTANNSQLTKKVLINK
ncbi:MAG: DUF4397 domain-containing protein [Bacteroidales bacterium]|nr:DUF4397 domain-containing protein [Bacteroidales bacterium]